MKRPMTEITEVDLKVWADKFIEKLEISNGVPKNISARELAFDWVHKSFKEKISTTVDDESYNEIAVHLYSYLASWGMVYYKVRLMQYNYKCLIKTVKILCDFAKNKDYKFLLDYNPFNQTHGKDEFVLRVMDIVKSISMQLKQDIGRKPTDTLICKILLGTFACIPALDSHFTTILKRNKCNFQLNAAFLEDIYDYALQNQTLNELKYKGFVNYPVMKIIDMAFWKMEDK